LRVFSAIVYLGTLRAITVTPPVEARDNFTLGVITSSGGPLAPGAIYTFGLDAHLAGELDDDLTVVGVRGDINPTFATKFTASAY
jgi:hypothetical protein